MKTGLAVRLAGVGLLGLVLTGTTYAVPANPGSSPPTTGTGSTKLPALPTLTAAQDAQLMTEATTLVNGLLNFLQIKPPAAEVAVLVQAVYHLLQVLTILQMLGGHTTAIP